MFCIHKSNRFRMLKWFSVGFIVTFLCAPVNIMSLPEVNFSEEVDQRSYWLGSVKSFSEMVAVGLKKLALSPAISPAEMDKIEADIRAIARASGIQAYREKDLIVTDLFPADVAKGKDVMLLYKGSTLDEYLALKKEKVGSRLPILIEPETGEICIHTLRHRWVLSGVLVIFALFLLTTIISLNCS